MPKIASLGALSSRGFGEFSQSGPVTYIEDVFSTYLYSGSSADQTIVNNINLLTKGGLVWIKNRNNASGSSAYSGTSGQNMLFDTERGMTLSGFSRVLVSNLTNAQSNFGTGGVGANTNGFTVGYNGFMDLNLTSNTYVSWTFRKQPKFFDVVTWTGDGTNNRVINHNLGSAPGMIFIKATNAASNWNVYHRSIPSDIIFLERTDAAVNGGGFYVTATSSTTFTIGRPAGGNASGTTYVAYLFAHNAGGFGLDGSQNVISCGSFTCDSSGNLGSVTLGYEPQYILFKRTDSTQNWYVFDVMRGLSLTSQNNLSPNLSGAEGVFSSTSYMYPTATGFAGTGNFFGANAQVIYMAIRRGPMKVPTDATTVFSPVTAASGTPKTTFTSGFPSDAVTYIDRGGVFNRFAPRLTGNGYIEIPSTSPEASTGQYWDQQTQFSYDSATGYNTINYAFLRAPGFFDVVCYTGTGVARTVSHNLGVAPELIIVKGRSQASGNWVVYNATLGNDKRVFLNGTAASGVNTAIWNAVSPTSSVFTVGTSSDVNGSGNTYVAYLFASCTGVSKVGSYTGTGATQTISCGFTGGARYVLIKRTDSTGSWWVWDTARGMVAGTDPRLALNFTNAEANANWVYTTTGGFQIVTSDTAINASGGTYIYLAIA